MCPRQRMERAGLEAATPSLQRRSERQHALNTASPTGKERRSRQTARHHTRQRQLTITLTSLRPDPGPASATAIGTGLELRGAPNVTALTLRAGQAAHLAGYLSGLMEARRTCPRVVDTLSRSSAESRTSHNSRHWFKGSQRGCGAPFRAWRFTVTTHSSTTTRRPARGSRTGRSTPAQASFSPQQAIARLGALTAAGIRGVWGVASGEDLSHLGPHILASAARRPHAKRCNPLRPPA